MSVSNLDPAHKLRPEVSQPTPPITTAAGAAGSEKLRDKYGPPFAFHKFPAECHGGPTSRPIQRLPSPSPTRLARPTALPPGNSDRHGTWPAVPSPARSKSARAPTSRHPAHSPFTDHRPTTDAETGPLADDPACSGAGGHITTSCRLPFRTTDAREGPGVQSPFLSRSAQPALPSTSSKAQRNPRLRVPQPGIPMRTEHPATVAAQPSHVSFASSGGGSASSGRLSGRIGDFPTRVTPPSQYPSKPKCRITPPRPGLATPPRGHRPESSNHSDQGEPGAMTSSLQKCW